MKKKYHFSFFFFLIIQDRQKNIYHCFRHFFNFFFDMNFVFLFLIIKEGNFFLGKKVEFVSCLENEIIFK
jgi:hypothetical protein